MRDGDREIAPPTRRRPDGRGGGGVHKFLDADCDNRASPSPSTVIRLTAIPAPGTDRRRIAEAGLDLAERVFVLGLFVRLALSVGAAVGHGATWFNFIQVGAEGLVVVLVMVRRRAREVSLNPADWALAFAATAGPLLIRPALGVQPLGPPVLAALLMIGGLVFQVWAKLTLRRSFGVAPAHRGLALGGPYRLVRHPIYLAYLLGQVGFLLLNPTAWNLAVYAASAFIQVLRIGAEERLLSRDPEYRRFQDQVRYRLAPGLW